MSSVKNDSQAAGKNAGSQETEFLQTDLWLNLTDSGRAVKFNNGNTDFYAAVSLIKELITGTSKAVGFSRLSNDEFKGSRYFVKRSDSGKALVLPYHGRNFVVSIKQVKRLIEGKIEGIPFSVPTQAR